MRPGDASFILTNVLTSQTGVQTRACYGIGGITVPYTAINCVVVQAAGYVPSADKLSCVLCDPSSGNTTSFGNGFSMVSAWEPAALTVGGACQDRKSVV